MFVSSKKKGRSKLIQSGNYIHEGIEYDVNYRDDEKWSPLNTDILDKFTNEILAMRQKYSRICAIRFDLHVPDGIPVAESNTLVSRLFTKLKDKFKAKKWDHQPIKNFAYGWVGEIEKAKHAHYHLWIAVPGNQVKGSGHRDYGMFKTINDIWSELTNGQGGSHLPEKPAYMISRYDDVVLHDFVYRVSYLAKERGKYSWGDKTKRFDGSRLYGAMMKQPVLKFAA
ncbi:hypothetical protein M977_03596 [Buttiauxella gaviniae ATCC 51604]|uniref:YagK/YfjJ C-terminal domain-containing protein n=1 Tax=Buttiauxella gaviniae ATCC 51604 TaxID=1354253 RepID=A0A1B7HSN7_9ENTR|nr:inovirus-type Gp2 protein [Buttiauxella gaviniae]OAT18674.1 hypothetical protein M977_03596 [Buttiauxella gaviniae ATCC 51604]